MRGSPEDPGGIVFHTQYQETGFVWRVTDVCGVYELMGSESHTDLSRGIIGKVFSKTFSLTTGYPRMLQPGSRLNCAAAVIFG